MAVDFEPELAKEARQRHGGHHKDGAIQVKLPELKKQEWQARDQAGAALKVSGRYVSDNF